MTFSVYFAGDLFDHKHLIGNALLAEAIERHSDGRYTCVTPQDLEQSTGRAADIRNQDLKQVMACDLGLFNFDGADLDSGTVVEFMMAKFLDIPAVVLRSDFRSSGDQDKDGDDWNLMCSFYPRVRQVRFNAMAWYQEARAGCRGHRRLLEPPVRAGRRRGHRAAGRRPRRAAGDEQRAAAGALPLGDALSGRGLRGCLRPRFRRGDDRGQAPQGAALKDSVENAWSGGYSSDCTPPTRNTSGTWPSAASRPAVGGP